MATKNTMEDLLFAEHFLEYTSIRSMNPKVRARARFVVALVKMLDQRNPGWRDDYLKHLDEQSLTKDIKEMFDFPNEPAERLFDSFLTKLTGANHANEGTEDE